MPSDEEISEWKETWTHFADKEKQTVPINDLETLMRGLGKNPLMSELEQFKADHGNGPLDFEQFVVIMGKPMKHQNDGYSEDDIVTAFKCFDSEGSGKISVSSLKQIMFDLGDKLTQEEMNEMLKEANPDGDQIHYEAFVKSIFEKS